MLKVRLRLPVYVVIVLFMLLIGSRQSATTMASDAAHRGLIFAIAHCMTSGADEKGADDDDDDDDDDMTRRLAVLLNLTTGRIPVIQRLIVISERTLVPAGVDLEGLPLIGDFAASKAQWLVLASTATACGVVQHRRHLKAQRFRVLGSDSHSRHFLARNRDDRSQNYRQ